MARRISVRGTSGSGKSTFGQELARRLGLAYIELDALHHGPNWNEATAEELRVRVREAMDGAPDGWVIAITQPSGAPSIASRTRTRNSSAVASFQFGPWCSASSSM